MRLAPIQSTDRIGSSDLQRREQHLTAFACAAIAILTGGAALLMYPAVFAQQGPSPDKALLIAFVGFCGLGVLLMAYIWESQTTIGRLRSAIESDRRKTEEVRKQASRELLTAIPKLGLFRDLLAMECRRTIAMSENLSILVVTVQPSEGMSSPTALISILADASKAIARKLRAQDSIYLLGEATFGVVLPGVSKAVARGISARLAEGLADAAGASSRFSCKSDIVSYSEDASSPHDLQEAICALIPPDNSVPAMGQEALN
jgi:GGDEF domain-containing protein